MHTIKYSSSLKSCEGENESLKKKWSLHSACAPSLWSHMHPSASFPRGTHSYQGRLYPFRIILCIYMLTQHVFPLLPFHQWQHRYLLALSFLLKLMTNSFCELLNFYSSTLIEPWGVKMPHAIHPFIHPFIHSFSLSVVGLTPKHFWT